jgi:pyruvate dehydrogenase E1 component beta subunit
MNVGAGGYMAAQHQISPYAMYMNVPGLKLVLPATPHDAKGLLKTAMRENNPVVFFPHTVLGQVKGPVPDDEYTVPFGQADVARKGADVTVVALSRMRYEALAAAGELAQKGVSVEVIDPRTLVPLDIASIRDSVVKTGRLVVVDEACPTCSAASEILALVAQDTPTFKKLKSSPKLVTGINTPIPYSPVMERFAVPDRERIVAAVKTVLA